MLMCQYSQPCTFSSKEDGFGLAVWLLCSIQEKDTAGKKRT